MAKRGRKPKNERKGYFYEEQEQAVIDYAAVYPGWGETAIHYAKDLKDRYTVLWMNYDLFGGKISE